MNPQPLTTSIAKLIEEHGAPLVLDVEHSIQVHKPVLTGSDSPASYYIRPPEGMSAEAFMEWFESIPGSREFRLTLVSILGIDTYHQPLLSADDFAKKYFQDNHMRFVRVVGKSNAAIETMAAFVEALKRPFQASQFPHHADFSVSGYRPPEAGRATEVKLLFKPADHTTLMKVERLVSVLLDECNLGRELGVIRHATRSQPPELILTSTTNTPAGVAFLDALAKSLPYATPEDVAETTQRAHSSASHLHVDSSQPHARFTQPKVPTPVFAPEELKRKVIAILADVLRAGHFAGGTEIKVVHAGLTIEVTFPRSVTSLWIGTTFREAVHINEVANFVMGVRTDPSYREGWSAVYSYDNRSGNLHIRVVETGAEPPTGWKLVPR
jgi:hypothetical protein